ncbi:MAG: hypothetical protein ACI9UQ_000837, partial [Candidatus Krumholzibacteriia bacterium]
MGSNSTLRLLSNDEETEVIIKHGHREQQRIK